MSNCPLPKLKELKEPLWLSLLTLHDRSACLARGRFAGSHNHGDAHDKVLIDCSQREAVVKAKEFAHGNVQLTSVSMGNN